MSCNRKHFTLVYLTVENIYRVTEHLVLNNITPQKVDIVITINVIYKYLVEHTTDCVLNVLMMIRAYMDRKHLFI